MIGVGEGEGAGGPWVGGRGRGIRRARQSSLPQRPRRPRAAAGRPAVGRPRAAAPAARDLNLAKISEISEI